MTNETSAEQIARRYYRQDHFCSQVIAERAYFRLLSDWLARGQINNMLARRLHRSRARGNALVAENKILKRQLAAETKQSKATMAALVEHEHAGCAVRFR